MGHWKGCDRSRNAEVVWKEEEGLDGLVNVLLLNLWLGCVEMSSMFYVMLLVSDTNVMKSFRMWVYVGNGPTAAAAKVELSPKLRSGFDPQVLNLTRAFVAKHQRDVVPLIEKYAEEWRLTGNPIYRPMWWLSPSDPVTFTIDDQFLIGDEVT